MPKPSNIHMLMPSHEGGDLRANVTFKPGPIADQIRDLSTSYQLDPASVIRMLVVEGLKHRK